MVYSAIETTCFGFYWPSSGFYNIEEESINVVKTCVCVSPFPPSQAVNANAMIAVIANNVHFFIFVSLFLCIFL